MFFPAIREVKQTLEPLSIFEFNDSHGRTQEEVLGIFDSTIARVDEHR